MLLRNEVLLSTIFENELILDGFLQKIELIFKDTISIVVLIKKGDITLRIVCEDIKDFLFTSPSDGDYLISSFKLFKKKTGEYYFCFDPVSEIREQEQGDTDFLIFMNFYLENMGDVPLLV